MIRRRARQSGFTLMELLLALGMASVLALVVYKSLRTAFKARDTANAAVGPVRSAQVAMSLVRQDLESVPAPTGLLAGAFYGQHTGDPNTPNDSMQFFSIGGTPRDLNDPTRNGGIRQIELSVETLPQENVPALVRRTTGNLLSQQTATPEAEILCRGVRSFGVLYYDGQNWQDNWDSTQQGDILPVAVRLSLELISPGDTTSAPSVYKVSSIIAMACHKDATTTSGATK